MVDCHNILTLYVWLSFLCSHFTHTVSKHICPHALIKLSIIMVFLCASYSVFDAGISASLRDLNLSHGPKLKPLAVLRTWSGLLLELHHTVFHRL